MYIIAIFTFNLMDLKFHILFLSFRLSNALLCKTSFVPDEYWQSLEVAHKRTFGCGYLTWEWHTQLRSYMFPLLFECLYHVLSMLGEFQFLRFFLVLCPRLVMAILAYLTDVYSFKICDMLFGRMTAVTCLYLQITSWFVFYAITRTLINSFETFLLVTIFHLFCQLMIENSGRRETQLRFVLFLSLIGFVCYIRPTSVPCVSLYFLVIYYSKTQPMYSKILLSIVTTLTISPILIFTDAYLYGEVALPLYNFLSINVVSGVASLFGTHPVHWYLTQCIPVILLTNIPAFMIGLVSVTDKSNDSTDKGRPVKLTLPALILLNIALLSPEPHKEFTFLLPMLPLCHILTARGISIFYNEDAEKIFTTFVKNLLLVLPLLQIPMSFYFGFIHQRGVIRVTDYLYGHISTEDRVLFLMPCHSTPLYSHIHKNATLHFLECSQPNYEAVDKSDVFYQNVLSQTDSYLSNGRGYSYVTCFSTLSEKIESLLTERGYQKRTEIFHTHLPEGRIGSHLHVFKKYQ